MSWSSKGEKEKRKTANEERRRLKQLLLTQMSNFLRPKSVWAILKTQIPGRKKPWHKKKGHTHQTFSKSEFCSFIKITLLFQLFLFSSNRRNEKECTSFTFYTSTLSFCFWQTHTQDDCIIQSCFTALNVVWALSIRFPLVYPSIPGNSSISFFVLFSFEVLWLILLLS